MHVKEKRGEQSENGGGVSVKTKSGSKSGPDNYLFVGGNDPTPSSPRNPFFNCVNRLTLRKHLCVRKFFKENPYPPSQRKYTFSTELFDFRHFLGSYNHETYRLGTFRPLELESVGRIVKFARGEPTKIYAYDSQNDRLRSSSTVR